MSVIVHERPGVYSTYQASTAVYGRVGRKTVGVVAVSDQKVLSPVTVTSYAQALAVYGSGEMAELVRVILYNGGASAVCVAVDSSSVSDYTDGLAVLEDADTVSLVVCDSTNVLVQQAVKNHVTAMSEVRKERIAVVTGEADESVSDFVDRSEDLNHPRVVVVAPGDILLAAAVAGAIAGERDPAVPLGGAVLSAVPDVGVRYSENDVDSLILGGVTPVEQLAGEVSVIRGVTSCTTLGGVSDATWRELGVIRIVDDVIPAVRNSLRAKFQRAKNTAQSRGAIHAQVVLELEEKLSQEIISGYDGVLVEAKESDPTVCLVSFSFTVAHALNQIWITANINV